MLPEGGIGCQSSNAARVPYEVKGLQMLMLQLDISRSWGEVEAEERKTQVVVESMYCPNNPGGCCQST
jgi:hypothetical protein